MGGQSFSPEDLALRKSKGFVSTCYTCCTEVEPNLFTNSEPSDAAFLPLYCLFKGLDGYLHWLWMNWNNHPLTDSRYRLFPTGDTYCVIWSTVITRLHDDSKRQEKDRNDVSFIIYTLLYYSAL